jgi:GT2 family glycosyltransferase
MHDKNSSVSVIVLNWNGKRFLQKCIGSLLNQSYQNYEIILVDNGSTDSSLAFVESIFGKPSKLKLVAFDKNYGFSKGNNMGIKLVNSKFIIVLNNDTEVGKDFVKKLVQTAEGKDDVGSVGCRILFMNSKLWFSQKFTNIGFIVPCFLQSLLDKKLEEVSNGYSANLSNSGCAVLFRKSVIDKIGGFDEDFWSNWEDWDLGYRINIAGFKCVSIPDSLVYHVGGGSEGSSPERYVRIYRNELLTYFKNYDTRNLLLRFPFVLFLLQPIYHLVWFTQRLITRSPELYRGRELDYLIAREKAVFNFLLKLKIFVKKRYLIQALRITPDKEIFRNTKLNIA